MKRAIERLCRKIQTYWDEREKEKALQRERAEKMKVRTK
jgi:hypothetical protein